MKKLIKSALLVATIFTLNADMVLADAYSVYTPYTPHKPIQTGLENTSIFYISAMVLFVLGLATLSTAKTLKEKLSK
ncbi:hypothetical protein K8R14_03405 [bacterium]|nr:hypothetical protein [bacterium]